MHLSIHYYILSLSDNSCKLYEGFRETLIEIGNGDFPVEPTINDCSPVKLTQMKDILKKFYKDVDQIFTKYYNQDPLKLVLTGERINLSIFRSVSMHDKDIIGEVEGNHEATSTRDLGQIVWPMVREVLSGNREKAFRELNKAVNAQKVASGLDEVWRSANSGMRSILLVEDDYHVKGSILKTDSALIIFENVDIMEVFDDVIDTIIEKVLEMGGTVVFLENGSLAEHQRIALIHS